MGVGAVVTREQVVVIALTGLVLIVGVAGLVADRGRRQWAARCAERSTERNKAIAERADLQRRYNNARHHVDDVIVERDAARELIADMLPHLKHAGMSPLLKRRAADLLDGS